MKTASETLKAFEDDREYHFHELDRDWIIQAMEKFASQFRPFSSSGEAATETDWKGQYEDARCEIADLKEQLNDAVGEIRQLNSELRIRGANPYAKR